MILNNDRALKVAEFLLQIKAIKLQPANPFTWASGWKSPIYCDNRKTLSYPTIRTFIRQAYAEIILEKYGKPDFIAGVATGGIAQGALVAQELGLPFVYVRSTPKGNGMGNQIEGDFEAGQKVGVIEDLISTGKSSLQVVDVLQQAGLEVVGMISIFTYGFTVAENSFKKYNLRLKSLTDYETLIAVAIEKGLVKEEDQNALLNWRADPENWGSNA